MAQRPVFQFKITLQGTKPDIWRRIQISDLYTFWDLHVAIQDVMGWKDYHLHHFEVINPITDEKEYMGIATDDDFDILNTLPGWEYRVRDYISIKKNHKISYVYDYGDDWEHLIEFEGEFPKTKESRHYPICLGGKRACPPEDVGGIPGYEEYIIAIADRTHKDHKEFLQWRGKYDPEKFNPKKVKFDNPSKRWKKAFAQEVE